MKLAVAALMICAAAQGSTIADEEIGRLIRRIEVLSERESAGPMADTLLRAADLLRAAHPAKSVEFARRAARNLSVQTPPLKEKRAVLERALAGSDRGAIESAASVYLRTIEHSAESPGDYAWFAAMRRKFGISAGGDNASVLAREALSELADLVSTDYDFRLESLRGEAITLRGQRGQSVLLSFWATWCGPCQQELPALEQMARERPDLVVLAITDEPVGVVRKFMDESGSHLKVVLDPERRVFEHYRIQALPAAVVVDANGRFRAEFDRGSADRLERFIGALPRDP